MADLAPAIRAELDAEYTNPADHAICLWERTNALHEMLKLANLLDDNGNLLFGAVADEIRTRIARELGVKTDA